MSYRPKRDVIQPLSTWDGGSVGYSSSTGPSGVTTTSGDSSWSSGSITRSASSHNSERPRSSAARTSKLPASPCASDEYQGGSSENVCGIGNRYASSPSSSADCSSHLTT